MSSSSNLEVGAPLDRGAQAPSKPKGHAPADENGSVMAANANVAAHRAAGARAERFAQLHLIAIAVLVLGPLVVYPLARLVLLSLSGPHGSFGLHAYTAFFSNPDTSGVIGTTIAIVFASASIASALGVALAALLFFRPFPGAAVITRFLELFVAFPSFLVAFTLIFLYGSQGSVSIALQRLLHTNASLDFLFGAGGIVLAEVVFYAPFVVRPTLASFAIIDMRLIEAARSLGANGYMVALRVVAPLAWPGIAAGTILCFLLTLNEFGILLVLGSAHLVTLPVAIYSAATVDLDLPTAAAGAVVMLAMSLSLYALYRSVDRRRAMGAR